MIFLSGNIRITKHRLLRMQQPIALIGGNIMSNQMGIELLPDERLDEVNERITIIQKKDGLTFGTDAYFLASFIKQQRYAHAVELGTGTGIISLLCASKDKLGGIDAIEIQKDFYDIAKRNAVLNGLEGRIRLICEDVRNVSSVTVGGEVDVVFTNPPYMTLDSGKRNTSDRKYIARHEVCGDIGDFCATARRLLKHGGRFYCVWRPDRLSSLFSAMKNNGLEPKRLVFVHGDADAEPSMVLVSATKGGAEGLRILPPIFLHETDTKKDGVRQLTQRASRIYETMDITE